MYYKRIHTYLHGLVCLAATFIKYYDVYPQPTPDTAKHSLNTRFLHATFLNAFCRFCEPLLANSRKTPTKRKCKVRRALPPPIFSHSNQRLGVCYLQKNQKLKIPHFLWVMTLHRLSPVHGLATSSSHDLWGSHPPWIPRLVIQFFDCSVGLLARFAA